MRYIVRTSASNSFRKNHANSAYRLATAPVVPSLRRIVIELILGPRSRLGNMQSRRRPVDAANTRRDTDVSDSGGLHARAKVQGLSRASHRSAPALISRPLSSFSRPAEFER